MTTSSIIISAKYLPPTNHRGARFSLSVAGDELPTKGKRILLPYGYTNGTLTTLETFLSEKGIPVQTIGTVKAGHWVIAVSRSDWEAVFNLFSNS
jgi:hypothetical protein